MGTVKRDRVVHEIAGGPSPVRAADIGPHRRCHLREIRSHRVFEGSERWCNVPEPRIPCEDDVSGLGIPDAHQIDGYICWHQGESGPRTALQTYADSVWQLTLAVHPLNAADCVPPTVAEIDYLRVRILSSVLLLAASVPVRSEQDAAPVRHAPGFACSWIA